MNVKELDKTLQSWGKFWASRESLQGYASTSVTERCCQVMRTGIWASSDKHLFNHQADQVFVPEWVKGLDRCVEQLPVPQRRVISRRYIKQVRLTNTERIALWLAQAQLLSLF